MVEQWNHNPLVEGSNPSFVIFKMTYFVSIILISMVTASFFIFAVLNPVSSILFLILVFFFGSILLFIQKVEYFALLFMIVYVGAIVVLFLFIVMMLEIKMLSVVEKFKDLFSFINIVLAFFFLEILFYGNIEFLNFNSIFLSLTHFESFNSLSETNLYLDYSILLQQMDHLHAIGGVVFTEYQGSVLIAALILFLGMVGSIVMTLDVNPVKNLKNQDANSQALFESFNAKIR